MHNYIKYLHVCNTVYNSVKPQRYDINIVNVLKTVNTSKFLATYSLKTGQCLRKLKISQLSNIYICMYVMTIKPIVGHKNNMHALGHKILPVSNDILFF